MQQLLPLNYQDQKRLNRKFELDFNYNNNYIEGNTLTYGQTEVLLMLGEVVGSAKMKDLEDMKAHAGNDLFKRRFPDLDRQMVVLLNWLCRTSVLQSLERTIIMLYLLLHLSKLIVISIRSKKGV